MTSWSSEVTRPPSRSLNRSSSPSASDSSSSGMWSVTCVFTLFTFCPPGPPEREKVSCASERISRSSSSRIVRQYSSGSENVHDRDQRRKDRRHERHHRDDRIQ